MYEIFEQLCKKKGVTPYKVAKDVDGLTTATFSNWKAGRYTPKADKLQLIADYFGVSVEYLMTGEHPTEYHFDPETARIAQEIFDNPDLHFLFNSARSTSSKNIKILSDILETLEKDEAGDNNDPA